MCIKITNQGIQGNTNTCLRPNISLFYFIILHQITTIYLSSI